MQELHAIADVHLGNHQRHGGPMVAGINTRCAQTLEVLMQACRKAKGKLHVVGDLYDTANPPPQVESAALDCFYSAQGGVEIIKGNHDSVSDLEGDNALGPLGFLDGMRVVERSTITFSNGPTPGLDVIMVPFRSGPASTWLPQELGTVIPAGRAWMQGNKKVLMIHLGISDDNTAAWLKKAQDSINVYELAELCAKYEIHYVIAGNWHDHCKWTINHKGWEVEICQIGALVPTGWDNPGLKGYGGFVTVTVDGVKWEELPGPRFVKLRGSEEEVLKAIRDVDDPTNLYVRLIAYPEHYKKSCTFIEGLVENKVIAGGEVEMDTAEATADAKRAAQAATSADSLDEAISGFIGTMNLDPELEFQDHEHEESFRAKVKQLTDSYLTKAR